MKTFEEVNMRLVQTKREHKTLMDGRPYSELDEFEQEEADGLWHTAAVLYWVLTETGGEGKL